MQNIAKKTRWNFWARKYPTKNFWNQLKTKQT